MALTENTLLKWALAGSIVIVLNLFFNYGLSVFYPTPQWDDFCGDVSSKEITTEAICIEEGGKWIGSQSEVRAPRLEGDVEGYCDTSYYCRQAYDAARDAHARNAFIILIVLGIGSLLAGMLATMPSVVSLGLSYGGAISLLIASMRYWGSADDVVRLLILAVALIALIWVGIKKFGE